MSDHYLVIFEGDTNDADYIHRHKVIDKPKLERMEFLVNKLVNISREKDPQNYGGVCAQYRRFYWPTSEYKDDTIEDFYSELDQDDLLWLDDYMPHGEFGIHTGQISFYILESGDRVSL